MGGLVCSLNEALVDLLGHCYFPKDYGIAYGYSVPWWVVTAYVALNAEVSSPVRWVATTHRTPAGTPDREVAPV